MEAKFASFKVIFRKKMILNSNRSVLDVLAKCEEEAYSETGMEKSIRI